MDLLIHDLNREEWARIAEKYSGWKVISREGQIKPCAGCFGCWIKDPGKCVIKDGYDNIPALINEAGEVVVMSRYTYGGFSSFVKNVFDRAIGYILPYFEIFEGEMHHKKRYPEDKPFSFIFRGTGLTEEDKQAAERYVKAVCRNFRATMKSITFEEGEESSDNALENNDIQVDPDKTVLLNCSLRADNANSKKFLERVSEGLNSRHEIINLSSYLGRPNELAKLMAEAGRIVLGMPLYVDGIPSAPLRIMEKMEKIGTSSPKKVYVVSNMGLYESAQLKNLMYSVRKWSACCGYEYCGGVAIGAGEMMGSFTKAPSGSKNPGKNVLDGLDALSSAINESSSIDDIYADAYRFPRAVYMLAANTGWPKSGRSNGLRKKDLLRRIE